MAYQVLIPQDVAREGKDYLLERGYKIKMGTGITVEDIVRDVADCDAILARTAPFPAEVMKMGKRLKVIARHGVGCDNIDVKTAEKLGIWVTNGPLSNANSVAEHTIGLIIACARHLIKCDTELRKGNFEIRNQLNGSDLEGKILGLIGVGRIGAKVARKAALGLDMKVIGYDPYCARGNLIPEIELINEWKHIFARADFISLHLPANEETRGIVGKKEFEIMKNTAYLINCARGEVVNEAELVAALESKTIAGAGLDVYAQEPPEKNHPLFELANVILTPHNAAHTKEAAIRMSLHAAIGIDQVLSGKKPSWPVNNPLR